MRQVLRSIAHLTVHEPRIEVVGLDGRTIIFPGKTACGLSTIHAEAVRAPQGKSPGPIFHRSMAPEVFRYHRAIQCPQCREIARDRRLAFL